MAALLRHPDTSLLGSSHVANSLHPDFNRFERRLIEGSLEWPGLLLLLEGGVVLKRLLYVLLAVVLLLVGVAYLLPAEVTAQRSIVSQRPPATVFTVLASMNRFNDWSPWYPRDPNASYTWIGPSYGEGAGIHWKGNQDVGEGTQTITAIEPYSRIDVSLDFGAEGPAEAGYRLRAVDGGTEVTWVFHSDLGMNPVGRYFGLLIDRFLGPDYEQGLAQLKSLVEDLPEGDPAGLNFEQVEVEAHNLLFITETTAAESAAVSAGYADAYTQIVPFMAANGLAQAAPPIGVEGGTVDGQYRFDAAIPISGSVAELVEPIQLRSSYAGTALRTVHVGAYHQLQRSADGLKAFAAARGMSANGALWYSFVDDPTVVAEESLRTEIYLPIVSPDG